MQRFPRYEPTAIITINKRDGVVLKDALEVHVKRLQRQLEHPLTQESSYLTDFFTELIAVHEALIKDVSNADWIAEARPEHADA